MPADINAMTSILRIQPDGSMDLYGFPPGGTSSADRIFLDGISFHVGS